METIRLIVLILLLTILLTSCSASGEKLLSYQEKNFRAYLAWQIDSQNITAIITSRQEPASFTVEFTSPPSLSGITVYKCGEETTVTLGDMEIKTKEVCRLAEISNLFTISGTLKKSSVEALLGVKLNRIELFDGTKNENYTLYLYKDSGLPRRIIANLFNTQITLDIISFEFIT